MKDVDGVRTTRAAAMALTLTGVVVRAGRRFCFVTKVDAGALAIVKGGCVGIGNGCGSGMDAAVNVAGDSAGGSGGGGE